MWQGLRVRGLLSRSSEMCYRDSGTSSSRAQRVTFSAQFEAGSQILAPLGMTTSNRTRGNR